MNKTFLFAALCASTLPAHAVDGDILITQAKALAGNVTPGDAPGFPVTLSQPGKYKLAGNLTIADVNTNGIEIASPRVTLDLNGFAIQGPVTTTSFGAGLACSGTSLDWQTGMGIQVEMPANTPGLVSIINGTVAGMGGAGVVGKDSQQGLRHNVSLNNMRVAGNGRVGILGAAEIRGSVVEYNCGTGIQFAHAVWDSIARYNGEWGIDSASVLHTLAYGNGDGNMVATSPIQ